MTKSNKLGFVTAHTIPSVVAGINGFQLGAHSVNPKAETIVIATNEWYAPAASTRAAQTLAARGADVIAQHEDDTGATLGAKQAKVWSMGSEADTHAVAPQTYLSGSVYNWGDYLVGKVRSVQDGSWKAEDYSGDLKSGLVALGPINAAVPADVKAKVEQVVAGLKDGSIQVFKGPIRTNDGKEMVPAGQNAGRRGADLSRSRPASSKGSSATSRVSRIGAAGGRGRDARGQQSVRGPPRERQCRFPRPSRRDPRHPRRERRGKEHARRHALRRLPAG